jgi:hypothetical protein
MLLLLLLLLYQFMLLLQSLSAPNCGINPRTPRCPSHTTWTLSQTLLCEVDGLGL